MRFAPREVRPAEVRLAEVRPAEVRPAEVRRLAEVGPDARILFAPLIPSLHPPVQDFEMFCVCHGPSIMPLSQQLRRLLRVQPLHGLKPKRREESRRGKLESLCHNSRKADRVRRRSGACCSVEAGRGESWADRGRGPAG